MFISRGGSNNRGKQFGLILTHGLSNSVPKHMGPKTTHLPIRKVISPPDAEVQTDLESYGSHLGAFRTLLLGGLEQIRTEAVPGHGGTHCPVSEVAPWYAPFAKRRWPTLKRFVYVG